MNKKPGSRFKEWLIEQVSLTTFSLYRDDTDEEIAARIGVTLEVLRRAREKYDERVREEQLPEGQALGRRLILGTKKNPSLFYDVPAPIYEDWRARCDTQDVRDSVMLRSIVHLVLQSKTQPAWLSEKRKANWIYKGEWMMVKGIRNRERRYRITTELNSAAGLALRLRGERTRVPPNALPRWGICLFVNNQLPTVKIVLATHAMYKNAADYCLDPRIT